MEPKDNILGFRPKKNINTEYMHGWDFLKKALGEFIESCNSVEHVACDGLVHATVLLAANILSMTLYLKIKDEKIWDGDADLINKFINVFCENVTKRLSSEIYQKTFEFVMNNIEDLIPKSSFIYKYTGDK